jgi:exodeoxyribonuclease-3
VGDVLRPGRRRALTRIVSLNCNGIRSASRKGLYGWLQSVDPDVICVQETKTQEYQVPFDAEHLSAYFSVFADAKRRGYSGVGIYAKKQPDRVHVGLGWPEIDAEGRYVEVEFGSLSIGSLYVPSGTMGLERQKWKYAFLDRFETWLAERIRDGRSHMLCGDYNIAHREIDVYNPRRAENVTGFLPKERSWMARVLESGWIDTFRRVRPDTPGYTWWSNFQAAFEHDRGWRIDYELVTPDLAPQIRDAYVYREERFSDHAPLVVDYDLTL